MFWYVVLLNKYIVALEYKDFTLYSKIVAYKKNLQIYNDVSLYLILYEIRYHQHFNLDLFLNYF